MVKVYALSINIFPLNALADGHKRNGGKARPKHKWAPKEIAKI
jgi:hypothetical protein